MRFGKTRLLLLSIPFLFLAQACGNSADSPASPAANSPSASSASSASAAPATSQASEAVPSESSEPVMTFDTDTLKNTTGKTLIRNITGDKSGAYNATYAIISKNGTVAIADPYGLYHKDKILKADIITVTHKHSDHFDESFINASPDAKVSVFQEDSFTVKDIKVTSIPASHTPTYFEGVPSDFIYVFEVDGLRIAHFGDFGQDEITPEQLKKLGKIDVVLSRFSNVSEYSASTASTVKVLEQVKPKIAGPTHYEPEIVKEIIDTSKLTDKGEVTELAVDRADLDAIKGTDFYLFK
ncbi:MBL fold metallo-hydrolase [Cohnella mopanensis]|uniref:MBL fold metallo-hydrolase n=1 Tax=Cohnella mopanensis TaxID=2911966 RepID=UPI001EF7C9F4|nr:MBL fold metallo-hydrolase [Cohnella mopanensis]